MTSSSHVLERLETTVTVLMALVALCDVTPDGPDTHHGVRTSAELRLMRELMRRQSNHREWSRPSNGTSDVVTVDFGVALVQILNFDQRNQVIRLLAWKRHKWVDSELTWNPEDYGGITAVGFPSHLIWTPDIVLYSHVGITNVEEHREPAILYSNGTTYWIPSVVYDSSCDVDMTHFPFDQQICEFQFGSWIYNSKQLDMTYFAGLEKLDLENYLPSSQWEIINNSASLNKKMYVCCPDVPYCDLTFTITLKRKSGFYTAVLLLPALLLSLLVLVIFWIPPQRPDRTTLGMSVFGSFVLLLLVILESSPPSAVVSLGAYCCVSTILATIATIFSAMIVNLAMFERPMPRLLKQVFVDYMGKRMCVTCGSLRRSRSQSRATERHTDTKETPCQSSSGPPNPNRCPSQCCLCPNVPRDSNTTANRPPATHNPKRDWLIMTKVLDRIMFVMFLFVVIMCIAFVFPKPYHYDNSSENMNT